MNNILLNSHYNTSNLDEIRLELMRRQSLENLSLQYSVSQANTQQKLSENKRVQLNMKDQIINSQLGSNFSLGTNFLTNSIKGESSYNSIFLAGTQNSQQMRTPGTSSNIIFSASNYSVNQVPSSNYIKNSRSYSNLYQQILKPKNNQENVLESKTIQKNIYNEVYNSQTGQKDEAKIFRFKLKQSGNKNFLTKDYQSMNQNIDEIYQIELSGDVNEAFLIQQILKIVKMPVYISNFNNIQISITSIDESKIYKLDQKMDFSLIYKVEIKVKSQNQNISQTLNKPIQLKWNNQKQSNELRSNLYQMKMIKNFDGLKSQNRQEFGLESIQNQKLVEIIDELDQTFKNSQQYELIIQENLKKEENILNQQCDISQLTEQVQNANNIREQTMKYQNMDPFYFKKKKQLLQPQQINYIMPVNFTQNFLIDSQQFNLQKQQPQIIIDKL